LLMRHTIETEWEHRFSSRSHNGDETQTASSTNTLLGSWSKN